MELWIKNGYFSQLFRLTCTYVLQRYFFFEEEEEHVSGLLVEINRGEIDKGCVT